MRIELFVLDIGGNEVPTYVSHATAGDLQATTKWQTKWTSKAAQDMPNKVALRRTDTNELLGLMAYTVNDAILAVEIIYVESADHSNANLLHEIDGEKKYIGIAKALFAYAVSISMESGYDGVLVFKAKTSELVEYYIREFGASHVGSYDPFRLVIWEDAARELIDYSERSN